MEGMKKIFAYGLVLLLSLQCSQHAGNIQSAAGVNVKKPPSDCLGPFANDVVDKLITFYKNLGKKGDWKKWGIDQTEKIIKIWVLPPVVDFETSIEIIGRTDKDKARLRLMRLLESSIAKKIENHPNRSNFSFVDNSHENLEQMVRLIARKYSRKTFENRDFIELGKMRRANILIRTTIIPGDQPGIAPILISHLQAVESQLKFNFTVESQLNVAQCYDSIKNQFKFFSTRPGTERVEEEIYSGANLSPAVTEFIRLNLYNHTGETIFVDRFKSNKQFQIVGNYLDDLYSSIVDGVTRLKDFKVLSLASFLHSGDITDLAGKYRMKIDKSDIILVPRIVYVISMENGVRFILSLSLEGKENGVVIGSKRFWVEYKTKYVTICEPIKENKYKARIAALESAAMRVGFLLYAYSEINGEQLKEFKKLETYAQFNRAIVDETIANNRLCLTIDLNRITDFSFFKLDTTVK